jgi:hypothetical protein
MMSSSLSSFITNRLPSVFFHQPQTERLVQLEMWLAELITKKAEMGPVTMAILNGFLNLANFSVCGLID